MSIGFSAGFSVSAVALLYVVYSYVRIRKMDEGTDGMRGIASLIRAGASTFLVTEFRIIAAAVAVLALLFSLFVEATSGLTLIIGALMSSAACIVGMKSATLANVRTANMARTSHSVAQTIKVALCGGSISGIAVQTLGLLGLLAVLYIFRGVDPDGSGHGLLTSYTCNASVVRITTYSLGCSVTAMFNRVAGGNYTKAADISSDILAKIRHDMPEDDPRSPSVIADFIGDNVNDIAGNCSDLLESFVATIAASLMIAVTVFRENPVSAGLFSATVQFPILLAAAGLVSCLAGIAFVSVRKMGSDPARELDLAVWISAFLTAVFTFFISRSVFGPTALYPSFRLGWLSPWIASLLGIVSGVLIGMITEYYTSTSYRPTRSLAGIAPQGDAFVVTKGDAVGSRSCLLPVLVIGLSLYFSGRICGTYGIAISALGMLSFVGTTVAIDAFGPIADNAGGFAQACNLDSGVREITDKLDSAGNTTAAIGKGFAIGSAAFAAVSLIVAYIGNFTPAGMPRTLNIANFTVIAGTLIGGALIEYFSALLTDNTIESARLMAEEGDRQLSVPGVMEGTVKPDYNRVVGMAARQALKKMIFPSLLSVIIPIAGGLLFGVEFVGGLLVGCVVVAVPRALFMGNSGGAFDNAKKYIEAGGIPGHGKGSEAHKAAVTGDTVGDTRKDVVGVALDIFIKNMSTVANTLCSVFLHITLFG